MLCFRSQPEWYGMHFNCLLENALESPSTCSSEKNKSAQPHPLCKAISVNPGPQQSQTELLDLLYVHDFTLEKNCKKHTN